MRKNTSASGCASLAANHCAMAGVAPADRGTEAIGIGVPQAANTAKRGPLSSFAVPLHDGIQPRRETTRGTTMADGIIDTRTARISAEEPLRLTGQGRRGTVQ